MNNFSRSAALPTTYPLLDSGLRDSLWPTLTALECSLCALALLLYPLPGLADLSDRDQPLHIEADQMLVDDKHKTSTFTGSVLMTQGTMLIRGNKLVVAKLKDGFQQVKVYGNTASFRQKREGLKEYLEGYGERIEYDTREATVNFYSRARVKRELDEVRGDHIAYDMKAETFQVSGDANSKNNSSQRVRAVLQPKPDTSAPALPPAPPTTPNQSPTLPEQ